MFSQKGINKEINEFVLIVYIKIRVLKQWILICFRGSGGIRELREASRNHFHLSWYLSNAVVTGYSQKAYERIKKQNTQMLIFASTVWLFSLLQPLDWEGRGT